MANSVHGASQRVYKLSGTSFKVDRRYRDLKGIGRGSYGVVASANDTDGNRKVAIKKIKPMAAHTADAKHVLREVRLMRYLSAHPNIITMHDLFADIGDDELYIVMELLDSDLHRIIQSPQPLTDAHNRYFMYQLIRGIKYLHDHKIIHRDLKPGNLLVTRNCDLRITDFGLAREHPKREFESDPNAVMDGDHVEDAERMTQHVVTRWYRPPELMLCPDGLYSYYVDIWSAGCIFAELLGRKPLFPGKNFVHQLELIFGVIGAPKDSEVAHITNKQARKFLAGVRGNKKVPFEDLYKDAPPHVISLLDELLIFEPKSRYSAREALTHPYFKPFEPEKEEEPRIHPDFNFDFEKKQLPRQRLRQMIIDEVASFRHEVRRKQGVASASEAPVTKKQMISSKTNQNTASAANMQSAANGGRGSTKSLSSASSASAQNGGQSRSASSSSRSASAQRLRQQSKPPVPTQQQARSQRPSSGAAVRSRAEAAAARAAAAAASSAEESLRRAIENSESKHGEIENPVMRTDSNAQLPNPPPKGDSGRGVERGGVSRSPSRAMDRAKSAMPSPPAKPSDEFGSALASSANGPEMGGANAYEDQWRRKEQERRRIREEHERQEEMQRRQQALVEAKEAQEYAEYESQRQRDRQTALLSEEAEQRRRAVEQAEHEAEEAERAALERRRNAERERIILEQEASKAEAEASEKRRAARLAKAKEEEEIERYRRLNKSASSSGGMQVDSVSGNGVNIAGRQEYDEGSEGRYKYERNDVKRDVQQDDSRIRSQYSAPEEKSGSPSRPGSRGVVQSRPQSAAHGNFRGSSRPGTAQMDRAGRAAEDNDFLYDASGDRFRGALGGGEGTADYSHRPPVDSRSRPASRAITGHGEASGHVTAANHLVGSQSPGARSNGGSSRGSSPRNGTARRVDSGVPRYAAATAASNRATSASGLRRYSSHGSMVSEDAEQSQLQYHRNGSSEYKASENAYGERGISNSDAAKQYGRSNGDPYRPTSAAHGNSNGRLQQQRATSAPRAGMSQRNGGIDRRVLEGRDYSPPRRSSAVADERHGLRPGTANLAFGGGNSQAPAGKKPKKQVTVPKSPNFSKMSWQRGDSTRRRESSDPDTSKPYANSSRYNRDGGSGVRNIRDRPSMPETAQAQALKNRYSSGGVASQHRSSSRGRLGVGMARDHPPPARKIRF